MSASSKFLLLPGAFLCASLAMAVDPRTVFEVGDGNTVTGNAPAPNANCDWNTLNAGSNTFNPNITVNSNTPQTVCAGDSGSLNAYVFLVGTPSEGTFTGGSKDNQDVSRWKIGSLGAPDKNALTHGYAASYTALGDKILVFGGERFATNGDANIGVWFFQQTVGVSGSGFGPGVHQDGDVFAVSAFTNGGVNPRLDVYEWHAACGARGGEPIVNNPAVGQCADSNLKLIFSGDPANTGATGLCNSSSPGCSTVNATTATLAWPYSTKFAGGVANGVPPAGFYEGGFDLTAIFPGGAPGCFSSFLMETRTSQATGAELKDFLTGSFPECHVTVSKACACTAFHTNGTGYDYAAGGTVTNDGGGTLFNVTVTDAKVPNVSWNCGTMNKNDIKSWGNAPTGPQGACTASGSNTGGYGGAFSDTSTSVSNSAHVVADTSNFSGATQVSNDDTETCAFPGTNNVCLTNPVLSVNKQCVTTLEVVGNYVVVRVDYNGTVKNAGNVNLTSVSVTDSAPGIPASTPFTIGTLTPGQEVCYTNNTAAPCPGLPVPDPVGPGVIAGAVSYYPNSLTDSTAPGKAQAASPGRARFENRVTATGTNAATSATVNSDPIDAHCFVCPNGFCATANQ